MRKTYLSKLVVMSSGVLVSAGLAFSNPAAASNSGSLSDYQLAQVQQQAGQQQAGQQQAGQQQAGQQHKQVEVVTVEFEPNQHNLSQEAMEKIREKLQKYAQATDQQMGTTRTEGPGATAQQGKEDKVESIKVAAWSDQEFVPEQDLPEQARELAKNRAEAVENYISEQLKVDADITTFNMAEQAGLIARTFNTQEAELRSLFAREGGPEEARIEAKNPELIHIRDEGGPSKAVVVISMEQKSNGAGRQR